MENARIGIGIIGMGFMGRSFAQLCTQLDGARLVGVSDIVESAGRAGAERFGVPAYRDYETLIARPDVQAIVVATPEDAHVQPCVAALERGKAVLVEKPLADSAAAAMRIIAAQRGNAILMVGHVLRFSTQYAITKHIVDEGQIGSVRYLQTRRLGGKHAQERLKGRCSLPLFLGVHDYDIVRWFAGSEPRRVYAESQWGVLQTLGYDVEDTNWALITFENGVLAACETGWILPAGHPTRSDMRCAVQGSEGRLDVDLLHRGITLATADRTTYPDTVFMPVVQHELRAAFVHEMRHFLACVRDGREPLITPNDALLAVRIAEAVIESAKRHQPVEM
ncbi:MAG TPA: Gfo/Idh/MocA family oxidoreductase [bacterium]|nr:Gfo/Idh/MocA family oxidoreductase [bacterium]